MAAVDLEYNKGFQIYNANGTKFHDLVLHKCTYETVVMSLGDKISGILYYKDNALDVKMTEYIIYKGVKYTLVNPPTILKEGLVSDNGELKGMTKYSFTFYHPMYVLNNFSFNDVAVSSDQNKYLSQNKTFSWIGNLNDYVAKINKNLQGTEWIVKVGDNVTQEEKTKLSDVLSFDKNTIAEALKRGYETWEVPYVVDSIQKGEYFYINDKNQKIDYYDEDKRFVVQYGLPTTEITVKDDNGFETPFVFKMGQGVGLKNNSRNPKNNKIITRIAGYGSEDNIPYGYPQIRYYGGTVQYPLYYGIVGGQRVQLIKHPFTRNHLMPSVYGQAVYNKVNPKLSDGSNNPNYNPDIELVDYYDADSTYANPIKSSSPSYEIHEFGDIKPELGEETIINAVPVNAQETQEDYKQKSDFLQEILNRISSTDIDDEKVCLKTLYDKVDAGLSYYAQKGEEGGSEYWYRISVTSDEYYQYVSYESGNYNFTATVLKNDSSAPTPEWDDTMDDDGKYLQSYFKITLPILSFDLYACAAITQEMKINMRSGACIGCTFPVQVDWDDYKRNFYNSDGEFAPDGEQRDYTKYPDSSSGQITVMVKKELETFGTLMPNQYQQPTTGDKFVILGISLPESYITNAEQRLDADMKQYMRDNNVYYYEYPLKFDEHFLISNENILSQMKPNVVVRFEYAGKTHALYIKQMSVKYNESPLPKYDITLTDDIEIVLNQIGQVTDEVSKLRLGLGENGIGGNGQEYLRKDIDDTARGTIRMIKGMQVGERFVTGLLGEGGVFRKDVDGTTYLETDKLFVRMKAYFDTVEVKHYLHTGGNRIASQASGIVCSRVEYINNNDDVTTDLGEAVLFRCYFKANDGDKTIRNDFKIGDLAFCRETNVDVSEVNMHGYWRLVIGRNGNGSLTENKEAWIDLSNRASETLTIDGKDYVCNGYQNGSDAPIAQDDIIQLGNIADKDRQGAIVEYVGGEDAPSYQIFQGIGEDLPYPYTLEDKNYIGLGYSSQTGHAYMNVYGDVFIGAKPDAVTGESPTYIKYVQEDPETGEPKLTIKAAVEFQSPDDPQTTTTLDDFARLITGDIENIQSQIDGEIDTWFYAGIPTLQNAPANEWTTDAEKEKHTGDLYYDIGTGADAGKAYRFIRSQTTPYVYSWQYIDDTAITEALRIAAHAQDTADHKRRVFVTQPLPPYDIGDLWSDAVYPSGNTEKDSENGKYYKDLLTCKVAKEEGESFSISDWGLTTNYTDDSALLNFLDGYQGTLTTIRNQVDAKAETWYQDEDPSTLTPQQGGWYGGDDAEHVGDIWFCTKNHASPSLFKKGTTWIWQPHTTEHGVSYSWEEQEIPDEVFDKIDGKSSIYANDPNDVDSTKRHPSNYKANDVWILPMIYVNGVLNPSTYTINNIVYGAGEMLTALRDNETYSAGDWAKKVRYTDDSALNDFKTNQYVQLLTGGQITSDINSARQTADNAQTAAEAAQTSADNANTKLTNWASDSYISPTEKTALKTEWEDVKTEYTQICNDADKYSIDKTAFTSAYTSANAAFQKYTAATPENITVGSDYQNIKNYYSARQTILNAISDAAKTLAQNAATAYMSDTALNAIKYALNGGSTTQDGGLILSNIIALRDANQNVMSGMNGVYNSQLTSGGIAAWYGGAMTDHEQSPSALNYAKSLFRFDGSGYVAGGNVTWDKNGAVTIKNITTLSDSQNTNLLNELATFNNAFSFATSGTGGTTVLSITPNVQFTDLKIGGSTDEYKATTRKWVGDNYLSIAFFKRLFQAHNGSANVNPNDTSTTITDIEAMFGFWTKQYISALGKNDSGGSGGGGTGDVTWDLLASNSDTRPIAISHLTGALSGYATQSWVNQQIAASATGDRLAQYALVDGASVGSFTHTSDLIYTAKSGGNGCTDKPDGVDSFGVLSFKTAIGYYGQVLMPASGGRLYLRSSNSLNGTAWNKVALTSDLSAYTKTTSMRSLTIKGGTTNAVVYNPTDASATTVTVKAGTGMTVTGTANEITITRNNLSASDIPNLDWSKIATGKPTTLAGYGISASDALFADITAGKASKLASKVKLWGNDFDGSQGIGFDDDHKASLNYVNDITMGGAIRMLRSSNGIQFGIDGDYTTGMRTFINSKVLSVGYETTKNKEFNTNIYGADIMFLTRTVTENALEVKEPSFRMVIKGNGYVGIGTASPYTNLDVNGGMKANKFYFYKPNADNDTGAVYIEYISSGNGKGVHLVGDGFYSDSFVSALGKSDDGGTSTFDESQMWTALGTSITTKKIKQSYLDLTGYVQTSALAPYATQSWVQEQLTGAGDFRNMKITADGDYDNYSKYGYSYAASNSDSLANVTGIGKYDTLISMGTGLRTAHFLASHYGNGLKYRVLENNGDGTYGFCDWRTIWHSGNDGSGSGLDADLLDGKHASEFALASNLSNYLPLSGGTVTSASHQAMVLRTTSDADYNWVGLSFRKYIGGTETLFGGIRMDSQDSYLKRYDSTYNVYTILDSGNYATELNGKVTNAMLAGSIENGKLKNSSITVNGSSVSLGGSVTTDSWGAARTLTIGSKAQSVDGSKNVTWTLDDIGAANRTLSNLTNITDHTTNNTEYFPVWFDGTAQLYTSKAHLKYNPANKRLTVGSAIAVGNSYLSGSQLRIGATNESYHIAMGSGENYVWFNARNASDTVVNAFQLYPDYTNFNKSIKALYYRTSHDANSNDGSYGWLKVAEITVVSAYANQPLKFRVTQRGRFGGEITLRFTNSNSTDTNVSEFSYTGNITDAKIVKDGTTFSMYIQKSEGYDAIGITLVDSAARSENILSVTWKDEFLSDDPGGLAATCRYYLSNNVYFTYDSANGGVHLVGGGLYADTYISALGKGDDGGTGTFDESQMWTALGGSISNKQVALSHLTTALAPYALKTDIPSLSTLSWSGYSNGSYNGSEAKTISIPSKVSQLNNDSGYITSYTDTKNTAGSTNTSSKIFLIGATSQAANPQTYSHDTAYVGTDGCLYSGGTKVLTAHQSLSNYVTLNSAQTISATKKFSAQQAFTVAQGTAPFTVASTTKVTNLNADLLDDYHAIGEGTGNIIKQGYINIAAATEEKWYKIATIPTSSYMSNFLLNISTLYMYGQYAECLVFIGARTQSSYFYHTIKGVAGNIPASSVRLYYNTYSDGLEVYIKAHVSTTSNRTVVTKVIAESGRSVQLLDLITLEKGTLIEPTSGWSYVEMEYVNYLGNASTATSLETPRTLWGQNFDGTANVSGNMTGVGSITASGNIQASKFIGDLQGNADTATTASKLSTISKKAWGQTYWTSGGVPTTISGDMTGVGSITMNGAIRGATTISASSNVTVGGTLGVTGATTLSSTLSVSGDATLGGGLDFSGGGSMGGLVSIELNSHGDLSGYGGFIDFHFNGSSADYTSRIIEDASGRLAINSLLYVLKDGNVGIGTTSPSYKLHVNGTLGVSDLLSANGNIQTGSSNGSYVKIGGLYLVYDSDNNAIKVSASATGNDAANFYATGAVSAFGANTGSGGSSVIDLGNVGTDILPSTSGTYGIGSDSKRWKVYATTGNFNGALSANGNLAVTGTSALTGAVVAGSTLKVTTRASINQEINNNYRLAVTGHISVMSGGVFIGESGQVSLTHKLYVKDGTSYLNGNVGIGGYNSNYKLYVSGISYFTGKVSALTDFYIDQYNPSSTTIAYKIGTATSNRTVYAQGIWSGTFTSGGSDIRLKNIISYPQLTVDDIAQAPIFNFTWKDGRDSITHLGTSAQYWLPILPSAIYTLPDNYLTMEYQTTALAASVITARKVVDHELRIKQLEQENAILREEIKSLKAA